MEEKTVTDNEKATTLLGLLSPESVPVETLIPYIQIAGAVVLSRRHPFGYLEGAKVPSRYENIQIQIALDLYNRRGAEGQIAHTENGISRTWATDHVSSSLLKLITPVCESVVASDADII